MDRYKKQTKLISENKKVRHDFFVETYYEAGIILLGTEVKSLRMGKCNLRDSYSKIKNGEIFAYQVHIQQYPFAHHKNHEPARPKKLLMHGYEIRKIYAKINEKGYTLVPIKIYFNGSKVKISLGLAKGKYKHDKRESIRRREQKRNLAREFKNYR